MFSGEYAIFLGGAVGHRIRLPVQETQVHSLGWEEPLEKEMAAHFSVPAWRTAWPGAGWATVHAVAKSRTQLSTRVPCFCFISDF